MCSNDCVIADLLMRSPCILLSCITYINISRQTSNPKRYYLALKQNSCSAVGAFTGRDMFGSPPKFLILYPGNSLFELCELEINVCSATADSRFAPIQASELPHLKCKVSLLTHFEQDRCWYDWDVGTHGIIINFVDPSTPRLILSTDTHRMCQPATLF